MFIVKHCNTRSNEMLKRMKTVIFVIALAIAACNCEGIEVGFTGGVFSQDGYYVSYTSQLLQLYASVADIVVHGAAPGEFSTRVPIGYRWYIDDVLQEGLNGEAITLSYDQGEINRPATYTVKCEVQIVLYGDEGASWTSDWLEVGTRDVTFFEFDFKRSDGSILSSLPVAKDGSVQIDTVVNPNVYQTISLSPNGNGISLSYSAVPGSLSVSGNDEGAFLISATYRGEIIKSILVKVSVFVANVLMEP